MEKVLDGKEYLLQSNNLKVILPISYLGTISYYHKILKFNEIYIEKMENFVKQTNRNRCEILISNGIQTLTIPKKRKSSDKIIIKDIQISNNEKWQKKHWKAIRTAYNSSPFFEYYASELEVFYSKPYDNLFNFNYQLIQLIMTFLQIDKKIKFTCEFNKNFNGIDLRNNSFNKKNIEKYQQVFSNKLPFKSDLSIIDLLFNLGPESTCYLERQSI